MNTQQQRSTLFHGGTVWPGKGLGDTHALLVRDGLIAALGTDAVQQAKDIDHEAIDLDGGFLMPGFGEGHSHPIHGGLENYGPKLVGLASVEAIVAEVRRYAEENPDEEWIQGVAYNGSLAEGGLFDARWLDEGVSDRPVVLRGWDGHTLWCNSEALRRASITKDTPEPEMGEIPRRADGEPLGVLREWGALDLMAAVCPPPAFEVRLNALATALDMFSSFGITWAQESWAELDNYKVYIEAARRGLLKVRMNIALIADPRHFPGSLQEMLAAREEVRALNHPNLTFNTIKFFADGVIENETASLLDPYCTVEHHGMRIWEPAELSKAVAAVRAEGFQPYIHAIGDDAVRISLDAMEHSAHFTDAAAARPVVTHVQLASDKDLARFAELGVVANMQPLWAQLDALMTVLTIPRLGRERADTQYKTRTLAESGARLAFGSDWPASSADPREGIAIAASRTTTDGDPDGGWVPEQIIGIEDALDIYTRGTAFQGFADAHPAPWGTLAPGHSADLVWLGQDPRTAAPAELPGNPVIATYLAGQATYANDNVNEYVNDSDHEGQPSHVAQ
ncbi:amidohydrolase [Paeniglutamicibacter kerguelensis]|uniref:Amidohydrolase YtcJ n=1 Tax=Paeniglutamicibacter kerguelensis TaxID=254788 RepID=A0ABS4XH76_9MICC|nr:amidohydrolase [Paeniglutamicibacter kerguelensis]MBP2387832.1 putative amidohydrolase YtcJ [Paeniglutamicibacter kerguelensis]